MARINDGAEQRSTRAVGSKWITMSDEEGSGTRLRKLCFSLPLSSTIIKVLSANTVWVEGVLAH